MRASDMMRTAILTGLALSSLLVATGSALANLRAPRTEGAMPSSVVGAPVGDLHAQVVHEDLAFRCHQKTCQVTATYQLEADRAARVTLDFILPVNVRVSARKGTSVVPVSLTSAASDLAEFRRRLAVDYYEFSILRSAPALYRASATVDFVAGRNQVTFEYDQSLAATETDYGYFHAGRMVRKLLYVLWPLKEWSRAKDFQIGLSIEIDRAPPSWWKRTFGHPTNVSCRDFRGQRSQVGDQLVYRATIGDPFPDYLDCQIGDDDLVEESAR